MDSARLERAKGYLAERRLPELRALVAQLHPADLADLFTDLEQPERLFLLLLLEPDKAADVLEELPDDVRVELLDRLSDEQASHLILEMEADEAADVLGELPAERARRLLARMGREEAEEFSGLLCYPEDTAGGLMTTEFVSVADHLRVEDAIAELRRIGRDIELPYYVYVTDREGVLRGVVSLRDLVTAPVDAPVREIMRTDPVTVSPDTDQEEAARILEKYDLLALPVCDRAGRLLGIVTADDLLRVVGEEGTEDVLALVGAPARADMRTYAFPWSAVARRTLFLVFNLLLNLIAATLISRFTEVLEAMVAVAFFLPMLAATAGNVGTQSLALAVRGLATGRFGPDRWRQARREGWTGALVGLACGVLVGGFAAVWQQDLRLGVVVGGAMWLALVVAAPLGMFVPFALNRLGLDPAVASGPLTTTLTDNTTLTIYLLLATFAFHGGLW
ncbi:MAG: magnesium transporter [Armatimonadota bacterium]|nr:magnesium transporter [Armatimonadota bacterium]MDR5697305.1 magnesium transporter [Armatimonadota bacterium]